MNIYTGAYDGMLPSAQSASFSQYAQLGALSGVQQHSSQPVNLQLPGVLTLPDDYLEAFSSETLNVGEKPMTVVITPTVANNSSNNPFRRFKMSPSETANYDHAGFAGYQGGDLISFSPVQSVVDPDDILERDEEIRKRDFWDDFDSYGQASPDTDYSFSRSGTPSSDDQFLPGQIRLEESSYADTEVSSDGAVFMPTGQEDFTHLYDWAADAAAQPRRGRNIDTSMGVSGMPRDDDDDLDRVNTWTPEVANTGSTGVVYEQNPPLYSESDTNAENTAWWKQHQDVFQDLSSATGEVSQYSSGPLQDCAVLHGMNVDQFGQSLSVLPPPGIPDRNFGLYRTSSAPSRTDASSYTDDYAGKDYFERVAKSWRHDTTTRGRQSKMLWARDKLSQASDFVQSASATVAKWWKGRESTNYGDVSSPSRHRFGHRKSHSVPDLDEYSWASAGPSECGEDFFVKWSETKEEIEPEEQFNKRQVPVVDDSRIPDSSRQSSYQTTRQSTGPYGFDDKRNYRSMSDLSLSTEPQRWSPISRKNPGYDATRDYTGWL